MRAGGWLLIGLLIALVAAVLISIPRFETDPPVVDAPSEIALAVEPQLLEIELRDDGAGLRHLVVKLEGREEPLLEQRFPGGTMAGGDPGTRRERADVLLDAAALGLADGEARLYIEARDWSLREGWSGNATRHEVALRVDTHAPRVRVESGLTYIHRGGAAVVTYRVDEPTERDGVTVGDVFFKGYPLAEAAADGWQRRGAFFAVPIGAPISPRVEVVAVDVAGNRSTASFPVRTFERSFPDAPISLPARFLDSVVPRLGEARGIDVSNPIAAFDEINTRVRAENEAQIREIVAASSPTLYFSGAFEQLRGSKVTSRFAEQRSYRYQGREVSRATHFGFDLASTAAAPITSSNDGVVLFAEDLGIYGNCVIVDHGMGVTSLYGHLSRIDVGPGDRVTRGQTLGLSGSTGLAGGDHLHFAILLSGTYVDPLEWWDPKWVRSHIDVRLKPKDG